MMHPGPVQPTADGDFSLRASVVKNTKSSFCEKIEKSFNKQLINPSAKDYGEGLRSPRT